ncbi:delta(1)-pyrroline-2-carboxylate reductase family protein [Roseateles toxinivorans]|uniref:1-piperideine-2-carboxylate/1-pyrroline-2-carboxylate reductase [NAD(P)H] n=1 Tax=Roseateles toxinivorans TaxID=270368 RepID=A0A4R6QKZ1_9BURK|nr:delta(1)-pyrroline-2-carboxylate reductase family protein [Roseateles toxinivorans]TDP63892.1 1-piperideine-2-carboxylate/1-pyrroline-2-carboxylate reductase [NAD(P)H] [Roseateles toxinivorans]
MQLLDADATAAALPWAALLTELETVCREHAAGLVFCPTRMVVPLGAAGTLLVMPAVGRGLSITKLVTVHAGNASLGLPTIQGEVVVMDTRTGKRLMQLDGPTLTARRTAAVSLLAVRLLGAAEARNALLIGTGAQALAHAQALAALMPLTRLHVQGRSAAASSAFAGQLQAMGIQAQALTPEQQASRPWDLIITATTSATPVLAEAAALSALVVAVGAYRHDMAELPPALVKRSALFVDDPDGARAEAGDLLQAGVDWGQVRGLEHLVQDPAAAPQRGARVFKSVGCARWDLAAARVAALHNPSPSDA